MATSYKLTDSERLVLACIELRSSLTAVEVAKLTGLQERTARRTVQQLREREIIAPRPFINLAVAGYTYYGVYFSSALRGTKRTQALVKRLVALPQVVWLARLGGTFEFGMSVCAETIYELYGLIRVLSEEFPGLFHRKAVNVQYTSTSFSRGYLSTKFRQVKPLAVWSGVGGVVLDSVERRILAAIAGGDITYREAAKRLSIPLSTLELRIRKLEQKKVIAGYSCHVDSARFGMTTEKILLQTRGLDDAFSHAAYDFAKDHPKIVAMFRCFGTWDFEMNVETTEPGEVTAVVDELYERFQDRIVEAELITRYRELKNSAVPFTVDS